MQESVYIIISYTNNGIIVLISGLRGDFLLERVTLFTKNKALQYKISSLLALSDYELFVREIDINEFMSAILRFNKGEIVIVESLYLQGRSQALDILVNRKGCLVVYISQNVEYGLLHNVYNEPNFLALKEEGIGGLVEVLAYARKMLDKLEMEKARYQRLEKEMLDREDIRLAKLVLMKEKGFTESEAHKFITKRAMELRKTKGQIARMIKERVVL